MIWTISFIWDVITHPRNYLRAMRDHFNNRQDDAIRCQLEEYQTGVQRFIALRGLNKNEIVYENDVILLDTNGPFRGGTCPYCKHDTWSPIAGTDFHVRCLNPECLRKYRIKANQEGCLLTGEPIEGGSNNDYLERYQS